MPPCRMSEASQRDLVSTLKVQRVEGGRIYFVSDIHLGDGSHTDIFLTKDEQFLALLDRVEADGSALVILGDFLDLEQAWYFTRIVRAHREVITRLTKLAEKMRVIYVYGNHDPDVVLFRDILKMELCDKVEIDGHVLAVHGYEFDSYVGQRFEESGWATRLMTLYERIFRTRIRLPLRDNYTLSNRFVHVLLAWCSHWGSWMGALGSRVGRPGWGARLREVVSFWTRGVLGDPMGITLPAVEWLAQDAQFDTVVCGHSHVPGVVDTGNGQTFVNTGSWSFGNSQYGILTARGFELHDWISGRRIFDENYRAIFEGRAEAGYLDWYADQYLGYLRFRCGEEALREGVRPRPWVLEGGAPLHRTAVLTSIGPNPPKPETD